MDKADSISDDTERTAGALSGLEFEVSRVVQRLEAGARAGRGRPSRASRDLQPHQTPIDEILNSLERLVVCAGGEGEEVCGEAEEGAVLPRLAEAARAAVVAHAAAAHCSLLPRAHLARLHAAITADSQRWLTHMFRVGDMQAHCHWDALEGLVRVARMLLHHKYPRYLEDGAPALASSLPCIYSCAASPLGAVRHLCRQLGLPVACIRPVPASPHNEETLDVESLEQLMREDTGAGRTPLLVVGVAGAGVLGHCEALAPLRAACAAHSAWLHLAGDSLAAAPLAAPKHYTRLADSLTLTPSAWFGVPALPVVTLYRLLDAPGGGGGGGGGGDEHSRAEGLALLGGLAGACALPLSGALPLWSALRAAGAAELRSRLARAFCATRALHARLALLPALRLLSKRPGGDADLSADQLTSGELDLETVLEAAAPVVVWQFAPQSPPPPPASPYLDKLNSWLGQILQREAPELCVELVCTERAGVALRCGWLGAAAGEAPLDVEASAECVSSQLDILSATVALKDTFAELVASNPLLRAVDVPGWAGLGGVRYVPLGWATLPPEQTRDELNALNRALVEALKATDSAFSCGHGADGMACVRFGMVTADTDVEELLALLVAVGHDVEEQGKVLDTMTQIVKKGIEAATHDLERESAERLWQEGLLRRVPVVGRVVDWWSPPPAPGLRGRCLHLAHGTVESTENIYKYHMQIPAGTVPAGVARAPPPAEVQTAVGPRLSSTSSQRSASPL